MNCRAIRVQSVSQSVNRHRGWEDSHESPSNWQTTVVVRRLLSCSCRSRPLCPLPPADGKTHEFLPGPSGVQGCVVRGWVGDRVGG